jgi:hypothetical protein
MRDIGLGLSTFVERFSEAFTNQPEVFSDVSLFLSASKAL